MNPATDCSKNLRLVRAAVPLSNLPVVLAVHRNNCHQVGCPILAVLEELMRGLGASCSH